MNSKPENILITALLLTVGAALLSTSAQAAPLTYAQGDLLMGFRAGNATDTKDFVINIGPSANFLTAQPSTPLSIGSIGADLTALFGATWFNRADLFWSVVGFSQSPKTNTLYATNPEITIGVAPGSPANIASGSTQAVAGNKFDAAGNAYSSSNTGDSSTGSGGAATNTKGLRQLTTDTDSWSSYNGGSQAFTGNNWSYFSGGTEGNFGAGAANSVLDLYQIVRNGIPNAAPTNGSLTDVGYFKINTSGVVSYGSPGPVPEPTSVLLLASAIGVFGVTRRRARR